MTKPDFHTYFKRGIDHFNATEFWEAHEAWEELWLAAETDLEQFLQGLIQLAAAYHHVKRGTFRGAVRLFDAALARLDRFPRPHCGLDLREAEAVAREHRQWTTERLARGELDHRLDSLSYPKLTLLSPEVSSAPPSTPW
jgi:predicted metal-dependent hydrolase